MMENDRVRFVGSGRRHCFTMWMVFLVLGPFVSIPTSLHAQSTGELRFRFEPPQGVQYVLDGKHRMTDRELTLLEGAHRFTFWAPERRMLDTTFFVLAGRTQEFTVQLRYAVEFVDHRNALLRYERNRKWARNLPPVVAAGAAGWAVVSFIRFGDRHSALQDLREQYRSSADPEGIRSLKESAIPEAKDDFARSRTQTYVSTGVLAIALGATAYFRQHFARSSPPEFKDEERIRFEGLVYHPLPDGGTWAAGLSILLR